MPVAILKRLLQFVVPALILIAAWVAIPRLSALTPGRQELVLIAPYLISAIGMFLAVHFHRGRPFMALLLLLFFYWCSRTYFDDEPAMLSINGYYQAFALLLPFNLLLLTLMRERGVFSVVGRLRLTFLLLQAVGAVWLFHDHFIDILPYVTRKFTSLPFVDNQLLPQPAMLSGAFCFVLAAVLAVRRQTPVDSGLVGAMAAFFIASNRIISSQSHAVYCAAAALIVTQSVLRDSYNMAFRDDLTGIPSRRALNESLHGLGRRYTVAMLDVDHFKRFNDSHGHDVGDQVLKMVARKMSEVGGGGRAYRYGGEEFTILFPGRSAADALPHLEELRALIADYRLFLRGSERPRDQRQGKGQRGSRGAGVHVSVTISIGVAESGEGLTAPAQVIAAADKALYRAKNRGRNQISC